MLAERLSVSPDGFDEGWNFGPNAEDDRPVLETAQAMVAALGQGVVRTQVDPDAPHEAHLLRLDCSKARRALGWTPHLDFAEGVAITGAWYRAWHDGADARTLTLSQISNYQQRLGAAGARP
jgi:CDP-glucose 4,6-dehydratase